MDFVILKNLPTHLQRQKHWGIPMHWQKLKQKAIVMRSETEKVMRLPTGLHSRKLKHWEIEMQIG